MAVSVAVITRDLYFPDFLGKWYSPSFFDPIHISSLRRLITRRTRVMMAVLRQGEFFNNSPYNTAER